MRYLRNKNTSVITAVSDDDDNQFATLVDTGDYEQVGEQNVADGSLGTGLTDFDLTALVTGAGYTSSYLHAVIQDHVINFVGQLGTPGSPAGGNLILTLPEALWPLHDTWVPIFETDGTGWGVLKVAAADGKVTYVAGAASSTFTLASVALIDPYSGR